MATESPQPNHSRKRFDRTVRRIGAEAFWLKTYHAAICGMKVHAMGLDFFRVALNSLKDARLIRLVRVLEDDSQTASFWYLLKADAKQVRSAANSAGLDLDWLADVAARLKSIRDKTFVHIDKDSVFDPDALYKAAGLTHADLESAILGLWETMKALHQAALAEELLGDDYDGTDIRRLADLRDAALGIGKAA
jgi:hypothetical protein